jgi:hypothetical protein
MKESFAILVLCVGIELLTLSAQLRADDRAQPLPGYAVGKGAGALLAPTIP